MLSAEDQLAIRDLAARYNHAIDSGDGDAYAATFVEDGVLDAGDQLVVEGRQALNEFAIGFAGATHAPRHVATNLVVEGEGDRAELRAYVQLFTIAGDPPKQVVAASGTYADTLIRVDGSWRFVRRTFTRDQ